ncbi:MAG: YitT family protein [Bacilli bacterium]|nr:YitT family protein [Bacilli bacterium]
MNLFSKNKNIIVKRQSLVKRILEFVLGCFVVAFSYNIFIAPNGIVPGGVGGIAIIINKLFNIDNAITIFILNIFLLILSLILLGKEKTKASVLGTILFPIMVKITENLNVWLQIDTSKILLSSISGAILFGIGAGLIFRAGFTTGGTDIINQILSKYLKITIGKSMLLSDGLIVIFSVFIFGINHMLYSILALYIISLISDKVVLGISDSKMFLIVTDRDEEVKDYIIKKLGHTVTVFKGKGGYKREKDDVLMAILPTKDYYLLRDGIRKIDKEAFYIITDTYEVFGGE